MEVIENELSDDPSQILRGVIEKCQSQLNVRVAGGEHNVELIDMWVRDRNRPVSVVGAYLLVMQPDPDDDDLIAAPDPTGCAANALGCASLWLEGFNDGFALDIDRNRLKQWDEDDPRGQQYRDGLRCGRILNVEVFPDSTSRGWVA